MYISRGGYINVTEDNKNFELDKSEWFYLDEDSLLYQQYMEHYPYVDFEQINGIVTKIIPLNKPEIIIDLDDLKNNKILQTKQQLAEFLESHHLLHNREYYSVTQEKQALLTSAIAAYQLKVQAGIPATLKWNTTGKICREFSIEEITGLVIAITDYVQPRVERQQSLEMQIKNCTTQEELDNIIIDYEVV